ncbi:MAG: hypothetical protein IJ901_01230 [Bacteroidaceae bacterium]|nr:hypothetical protein [Bacteroidaceae bacterium]
MKKNLLLVVMFAALMMGQTVKAITYYSLSIGDKAQVTSENASDILGDGKFSYNVNTNTLVVNDGAKVSSLRVCIYNDIEGLTIQFCGSADFYTYGGNNSCIYANKDTRVVATGAGTVNLKSSGRASIYIANSTLTIEALQPDCNFYMDSSNGSGICGNGNATLKLVGTPTLNITPSSYALTGLSSINLGDCQVALPTHGTCKPAGNMESCVYDSFGDAQRNGNVVITHKDNITDYNLRVGGVYVTNWNEDKITAPTITGSVRYDWETKSLYLSNVTIDAREYNGSYYNGIVCYADYPYDELKVQLSGKNEIIVQSLVSSVTSSKNLCFTGSGSLETNTSIWIKNDAKAMNFFSRCSVKTKGVYSDSDHAGRVLTVNNASLSVFTIYGFDDVVLTNAGIYEPKGVRYDTEQQYLVTADGENWNARGEVFIKPCLKYGITVGGIEVTDWNAADVGAGAETVKSGHISYDVRKNILLLQDVDIDCLDKDNCFVNRRYDLTIQLEGHNTITNWIGASMTIDCNGVTKFTGDGTLDIGNQYIGRCINVLKGTLVFSGNCEVNATAFSFGVIGTSDASLVVIEQAVLTAKAMRSDENLRRGAVVGFGSMGTDMEVLYPAGNKVTNITSSEIPDFPLGMAVVDDEGNVASEAVLGESYGITVLAEKYVVVSRLNADSITADGVSGHISYDAENHVLTLDNVTIERGGLDIYHDSYAKWDTLHIVLIGENKMGVIIQKGLFNTVKISGSGTLTLSGSTSIKMGTASLVIADGCKVVCYDIRGDLRSSQTMTVDHATVQIKENIYNFTRLILNGAEFTNPADAYYDESVHYVISNGRILTGGCTISEMTYGITVANVQIKESNASNVTGKYITGRVSYDPENQVLTLDNAEIEGSIRIKKRDDVHLGTLTIRLIGDNHISGNIIHNDYFDDIRICGDGTLTTSSINVHGSLEFAEGCKVSVTNSIAGSRIGSYTSAYYPVLTVDHATLKVGTSIRYFSDLILDGVEFTDPVGAYFFGDSSSSGYVYDKDGNRITEGFTISPPLISVEDITSLIDRYLEPGSTVQLIDITNLIDRYLEQ